MPHQCTKCGKIYPDGDMRLLNGCECGNNRFIYIPKEKREKREEIVEDIKREFSDMGVESIRIIAPGQYEINIEKLLAGEGIVIALQENGRYVIHLPSLLKRKKSK